MKTLQSKIIALFGPVCILLLGSCAVDTGPSTSNNTYAYSISVAPQLKSHAVNTTQIFTANTAAPSSQVSWTVLNSNNAGGAGTPETQTGGYTFAYTAPATPPLYDPGSSNLQGSVTLSASTGSSETATQTFVITAPTITVGFLTPPTTVALGASVTIYAYAIGSISNGLTMEVNTIAGGNSTVGTIVPYTGANATYGEYVYTAPTSLPVTGSTITITAVSAAVITQTATLSLTL